MAGDAIAVSDATFENEVLKSDQTVLVDFWAEWCGPCRMLTPSIEAMASERAGKLKVVKVNIDENPHTPTKYAVRGIPTLMLFKGGQLVATKVGGMPKAMLDAWVDSVA